MKTLIAITTLALAVSFPAHAATLTMQDLTLKAPTCKTTKAKRPPLAAQKELPYDGVIKADFTGNGWCDYVIWVPYPANSQMPSYDLPGIMLIGSKSGWLKPLHGKKSYLSPISDLDPTIWPTYQVDLSDIQLIYPKTGGAPYVIGLFAGYGDAFSMFKKWEYVGCYAMQPVQYMTVYRWNKKFGTFKKVDKHDADVVLDFYYRTINQRCTGKKRVKLW